VQNTLCLPETLSNVGPGMPGSSSYASSLSNGI